MPELSSVKQGENSLHLETKMKNSRWMNTLGVNQLQIKSRILVWFWGHVKAVTKSAYYNLKNIARIDLSVSPSPRTQTSQWQSSISCTGSGTRTSLSFSAIEKHWKIRSLHRFMGLCKMEKRCAWGACKYSTPIQMKTKTFIFWLSYNH